MKQLVKEEESLLKKLGFKILSTAKINENGPDVWVTKKGKPYSIECKTCRITKRHSVQVPPVETNRRADDFILIRHPTGYLLFEPMQQHLKLCTPKGYRTLWSV